MKGFNTLWPVIKYTLIYIMFLPVYVMSNDSWMVKGSFHNYYN